MMLDREWLVPPGDVNAMADKSDCATAESSSAGRGAQGGAAIVRAIRLVKDCAEDG